MPGAPGPAPSHTKRGPPESAPVWGTCPHGPSAPGVSRKVARPPAHPIDGSVPSKSATGESQSAAKSPERPRTPHASPLQRDPDPPAGAPASPALGRFRSVKRINGLADELFGPRQRHRRQTSKRRASTQPHSHFPTHISVAVAALIEGLQAYPQ